MRFDERAATYDRHAAPQRLFALRVAAFIQAARDQPVLELGAGTGMLTAALAARGFKLQATDAAPAMLEIGRKAVPGASWSRLDAFRDELPGAALQVSSGLLQWADDPAATLQGWAAALRPGGKMVHAFPCEPCLAEWRSVCPGSPITWRNQAEWVQLFAAAGLYVARHELWVERIPFPSALELARSMHASGITGKPMLTSGALRRALREYDNRFSARQGVNATWAWLAIEASPAASV